MGEVGNGRTDADDPLFLGVDGGGSKTLAVVVDARGGELGRGLAGGSNLRAVGREQALQQLRRAAIEAARTAGATLPLAAGWFGLAGVSSPVDAALVAPLRDLASAIRATNDAELVLAGLEGRVGVALVAGTGSIALGRTREGRLIQVGGWGHLLGDEGSGYDIGRQGLQAAVRAADGRDEPTLLVDLVLQHFALASPRDLVGRIYQAQEKATIAALAPLVLRAAREGNTAAQRIVSRAEAELCRLAVTAIDALGPEMPPVSLALGGGLLTNDAELRTSVVSRIGEQRRLGHVTLVDEPALCAARALATTARRHIAES